MNTATENTLSHTVEDFRVISAMSGHGLPGQQIAESMGPCLAQHIMTRVADKYAAVEAWLRIAAMYSGDGAKCQMWTWLDTQGCGADHH